MADQPVDALVEVLLQVAALSDADVRDALIDETAAVLRRKHTPRRTPDARGDLLSLINSYDLLTGGLVVFTHIVADHHPDPPALRALDLAREIRGPLLLSAPDRR